MGTCVGGVKGGGGGGCARGWAEGIICIRHGIVYHDTTKEYLHVTHNHTCNNKNTPYNFIQGYAYTSTPRT